MTQDTSDFLRSYGRRQGRKLKASHSALIETLLPQLLITLPKGMLDSNALFLNNAYPLWFEIGFGGGEHLVEQARRNRDINFIGCEPYINGMAKLLAAIEKDKISNVRLFDGDARSLLEKLPEGAIERMFILFPDPWPKARHHKRRLITQHALALFHRKLLQNGLLRIATDHTDYGVWILEQLQVYGKFTWSAQRADDWNTAPEGWVETRYQAKAALEGRKPLFLDWKKT